MRHMVAERISIVEHEWLLLAHAHNSKSCDCDVVDKTE